MSDLGLFAVAAVTHAELVDRAARWLANTERCVFVLSEMGRYAETPDAIGWHPNGRSVLIECKASRNDFYHDRSKPWRRVPEIALGAARYYMTPPGLVTPEQLPKGWGLLEAGPRSVKRIVAAEWDRSVQGMQREMALLIAAVRVCHGDSRLQASISSVRHIEPPEAA